MSLSQFIEYCLSFYGPGGVYPLGMSEDGFKGYKAFGPDRPERVRSGFDRPGKGA
jgi:hypothetical protein